MGGLGHLGVQFAAKMGFNTVAIARGEQNAEFAHKLGAQHYIDSTKEDVAQALQKLGGARTILATVKNADAMSAAIGGLGYPLEPVKVTVLRWFSPGRSWRAGPAGPPSTPRTR